ncbi:MAG: hypothetical protein HC875_07955 [Anaerolineales bacterium]|nr:hypothetical protein [Anaerolineales bacterium]
MIEQAGVAPFAGDLLEADEALWGSFWQGDVIAPGYLLPAAELALLRATRLDQTWPEETTLTDFLTDLHQAVRHPQAGVWALQAAGEPCLIFAAPRDEHLTFNIQRSTFNVATLVWYCATTGRLHAGYRATVDCLNFPGEAEQRLLTGVGWTLPAANIQSGWLARSAERHETPHSLALAARLDTEILYFRCRTGPA